jgi:peptidylprolyl isomerase
LRTGRGSEKPVEGDLISYRFEAWTPEGVRRSPPVTKVQTARIDPSITSKSVFSEFAMLMVEGEVRRFWVPEHPQSSDGPIILVDFELLAIHHALPAPADVAAPPADAIFESNKLASKVLKKGTGSEHPTPASLVKTNYSGWTTDGKMFDSSVQRGEPAEFALRDVIEGWKQGLMLMVVGEKRRVWVPESLAFKGQAGKPQGMLVFDIELLSISVAPANVPAGAASSDPSPTRI